MPTKESNPFLNSTQLPHCPVNFTQTIERTTRTPYNETYTKILCYVRVTSQNFRKPLLSLVYGVFFLLGVVTPSYGSLVNLSVISKIESSNNPRALNKLDHGGLGSRGLFQISDALRRDYNRLNKKNISSDDLFNPKINTSISEWAFNSYFPSILKRLHKPVSVENLIVCQNAGCGALKRKSLPKITQQYLIKYRSLNNEL